MGFSGAKHIVPWCSGHPAVLAMNNPLSTLLLLCYSPFSMSSTKGRMKLFDAITHVEKQAQEKLLGPSLSRLHAPSMPPVRIYHISWQLMVDLMLSKCCNTKVKSIEMAVLMVIKHIQKRNPLTGLLLRRRCTKFKSSFGCLLCDLI